ncbi:Serine/threonine-protein kinase haspin [Colletotrichum musicola]|uniref:non-specific serine/threonine protein kinase n=1 Tax=Colletotrichum musicola TaxID=2175873 RepID=A0A8H6IQ41_9PEZI|nr:Serine/threonine-protein kinase haspin [Colletotrichum musicola]
MARTLSNRTYGKASTKAKARRPFAAVPTIPTTKDADSDSDESITKIDRQIRVLTLGDEYDSSEDELSQAVFEVAVKTPPKPAKTVTPKQPKQKRESPKQSPEQAGSESEYSEKRETSTEATPELVDSPPPPSAFKPEYRILSWEDVCPPGDRIEKIAEASYAEVYRVRNERGTSIIKCIRLESPIKAQTKAQVRSGLVDEEPHSEDDMRGELRISEWLADIPGFVIYKERYLVRGKAPKCLLETHQAFHRKMKRKDPDRLQFYPSPSRYLEDTTFLVVELGDAGTALEDFELVDSSQLWDIFFLVAVALARAEEICCFEHRDLHEGNLCIRRTSEPRTRDRSRAGPYFGYSGLEITVLDYGLSRAEDLYSEDDDLVALDLEKDLSIFTSTHAPQCKVYRQMRSFLMRGERACLPPSAHKTSYPPAAAVDGEPLSWDAFAPYTNVLWLAYLYQYMVKAFTGDKKDLSEFKKATKELWRHMDPDAKVDVPSFGCAADIVRFAVEAGWIDEAQLMDQSETREESIILSREEAEELHQEKVTKTKRRG